MFKTLLKLQFAEIFGTMTGTGRKNREKRSKGILSKGLLIALYAFLIVMFFATFFGVFLMLAVSLGSDLSWFYFTVMAIISVLMCVLMSVFSTYTQLFVSRDNELLLSMPIPPRLIVASRMVSLVIFNFGISLVVLIPAAVVYPIFHNVSVLGVVGFAVYALLIPFVSLAISSLLAYLFALLISHIKNKTLLKVILTLIGLVVYFAVYFSFMGSVVDESEEMTLDLSPTARALRASAPVLYVIGAAVSEGKILYLLAVTLVCALTFFLALWLISKSFIRMTTVKRTVKKKEYVEKSQSARSPLLSLTFKDTRLFFSNATYMINCGLGFILAILAAVVAIANRAKLYEFVGMTFGLSDGMFGASVVMIMGFLISMSTISSVSLSLEAKTLWQLQAMPIHPGSILMAKALSQMLISAPPILLSVLLFNIAFPMDAVGRIFSFVMPVAMIIFSSVFGSLINLWLPKFDWVSETVAIKQSMSVMITMFGTMIVFFAIGIVGVILSLISTLFLAVFYILASLLLLGVSAIIVRYFYRGGAYRLAFIN